MAAKEALLRVTDAENLNGKNNIPLSQCDMVLTQWSFIGAALTRPQSTGLGNVTTVQLKALTRQMYIVGKDLGIEDEFNLCCGSLEDITEYAKDIENMVIRPALELDEDYESMHKYLLGGINLINPLLDPSAFAAWTHKLFGATKSYENRISKFSTLKTKATYYVLIITFDYVFYYKLTRWITIGIFNFLMDLNIYMANLFRARIIQDYYAGTCLPLHLSIYGILSYIKRRFMDCIFID